MLADLHRYLPPSRRSVSSTGERWSGSKRDSAVCSRENELSVAGTEADSCMDHVPASPAKLEEFIVSRDEFGDLEDTRNDSVRDCEG